MRYHLIAIATLTLVSGCVGPVVEKVDEAKSTECLLPDIGFDPLPQIPLPPLLEPHEGRPDGETEATYGKATVNETTVTIPTYKMNDDDPYPRFDQWKEETPIYPYPMKLSGGWKKTSEKHKALVLENEYVKVVVLPELGGHLYQFYDKVNQRDIIYTNPVIKPGYYAVRGGWISGGFEFNFPRAHCNTIIDPIDYAIRNNPDGSASIYIGNVERECRMRWQVRLTLYPGSSFLRQDTKLDNRTPIPHRYHWWTIVAMPPNDNTQVIFPTARITNHAQGYVLTWPLWRGRDNSRYKTLHHRFGSDWSVLQPWDGFFAYWDHGLNAGLIHVANKDAFGGSKYYSSCNTSPGRFVGGLIMSDTGKTYDEIDSSPFLTQHDYRILEPFETTYFTEYWLGGNGLGGVKKATRDAAANIWREQGDIHVAINTNVILRNARLVVKSGEKILLERSVNLSPGVPYRAKAVSHPGNLSLSLSSSIGEEVLVYEEVSIDESKLPPEGPLPLPVYDQEEDKMTVEQLCMKAQFCLEHKVPNEAYEWLNKALARDPSVTYARNQLGIIYLKRNQLEAAISEFEKSVAIKRYQGVPHYYWGLVCKLQGDLKSAKEHLWAAVNYRETFFAAHHCLAQIALIEQKTVEAVAHLRQALSMNAHAVDTQALLCTALRKLGRTKEAEIRLAHILRTDPMNHLAAFEQFLLLGDATVREKLLSLLRDDNHSYAELAWVYANCGLFSDALAVLQMIEERKKDKLYPMLYYQMAYLYEQLLPSSDSPKRLEKEIDRCLKAAHVVSDWRYVFPNCTEEFAVLKSALARDPADYCAMYALGNLLASRYRHEEAIQQFQAATEKAQKQISLAKMVRPEVLSAAYRNLAFLLWKTQKKTQEAIGYYNKALEYGGKHHCCYVELADLHKELNKTDEAIQLLESGLDKVADPSDMVTKLLAIYQEQKLYDKIIEVAPRYKYDSWKGSSVQRMVRDARLAKGEALYSEGKFEAAAAELEQATRVCPENIPVMGQMVREFSEILWWRGCAYEKLGRMEEAKKSWAEAEMERHEQISPLNFFQAKCLQKVGKTDEATAILDEMLFFGRMYEVNYPYCRLDKKTMGTYIYLQALAHDGKGNSQEAKTLYEKVLELAPDHAYAKERLQAEALKK